MIYDCFQFFNEIDLLKLRLKTLNPIVDYFVICESTVTFSGERKPLYYNENRNQFDEFNNKIIHVVIDDTPNFNGITAFERDAFQKAARIRGLRNCKDSDIVLFSDLDEIPNPDSVEIILKKFDKTKIYHFAQRQFYFYLNLEEISGKLLSYAGDYERIKNKKWLGTYMFELSLLKKYSIEKLRIDKSEQNSFRVDIGGWHFTYMGGDKNTSVEERVAHKVKSAAHQEFNNESILSNIQKNINKRKDIFGRAAKMKRVEIDNTFPKYLNDNLSEFDHLILKAKDKKTLFSWFKK